MFPIPAFNAIYMALVIVLIFYFWELHPHCKNFKYQVNISFMLNEFGNKIVERFYETRRCRSNAKD